jgi:hypothetical protein
MVYTRFKQAPHHAFTPKRGQWKKRILHTGQPQIVVSCRWCGTCRVLSDPEFQQHGAHALMVSPNPSPCWSCSSKDQDVLLERYYESGKIVVPDTCFRCSAPRIILPLVDQKPGDIGDPFLCGAWYSPGDPPEPTKECPHWTPWWTEQRIKRFVSGACPLTNKMMSYRPETHSFRCWDDKCQFKVPLEVVSALVDNCLQMGYPPTSPKLLKMLPPAVPKAEVKKTPPPPPPSPIKVKPDGSLEQPDSKSIVTKAVEKMLSSLGDAPGPSFVAAVMKQMGDYYEKTMQESMLMSAMEKENVDKLIKAMGVPKEAVPDEPMTSAAGFKVQEVDFLKDDEFMLVSHNYLTEPGVAHFLTTKFGSPTPPAGISYSEHLKDLGAKFVVEASKKGDLKIGDSTSQYIVKCAAEFLAQEKKEQEPKPKPKKFGGPVKRKFHMPEEEDG